MVEYVILVALIAVALVVSTEKLGISLSNALEYTATSLAALSP
jgi:Flp pilus assembly pilin Flp